MRIPLLPTFLSLFLLGSSALAQDSPRWEDPWYLQLQFGAALANDIDSPTGGDLTYDVGWELNGALGRRVADLGEHSSFDLELELFFMSLDLDENDVNLIPSAVDTGASTSAVMVNGMFDLAMTPKFSFIVGGGVGYALDISMDFYDQGNFSQSDDSGVAFQGKIGVEYQLGGTYSVLLNYRYFATDSVQINDNALGGSFDVDNSANIFEVGVRWGI